ncbi:MAG: hypothetical protein LBC13_03355, partial [Clostridiales bacterium]|nr:hypothetical protein [Clostridiales bacterium]
MDKEMMFVKAKMKTFRVLKVLSYLLGFPLMLYVIYAGAKQLGVYEVAETVDMSAFWIAFWCCVGFAVFNAAVEILLRKKKTLFRGFIIAAVALLAVMIPAVSVEESARKSFNELRDGYAATGYVYDGYEKQLSDYLDRAKSHDRAFDDFVKLYNLDGTAGSLMGGNTDGTPTAEASDKNGIFLSGYGGYEHYVFGREIGGSYSMNGLYADGFVFGYDQAKYILTTYYAVRESYAAKGLDADAELKSALAELDADGSVWSAYKQTEEYLRAYGDAPAAGKGELKTDIGGSEHDVYDLYAGNYYLTPAKVKKLLNAAAGHITGLPVTGDLVEIIKTVASIAGFRLSEESLDALNNYRDLNYDGIMTVLSDLNIELDGGILNEEFILNT